MPYLGHYTHLPTRLPLPHAVGPSSLTLLRASTLVSAACISPRTRMTSELSFLALLAESIRKIMGSIWVCRFIGSLGRGGASYACSLYLVSSQSRHHLNSVDPGLWMSLSHSWICTTARKSPCAACLRKVLAF